MNPASKPKTKMDEKKKIEFEKALELRGFEISNFWSRGWFFGALILATVSGYITNISLSKPILPSVCISFLVLLFSILQTLMNRGSKYWQERWEYMTKNRETELGINLTKATKYNNCEKFYLDRCILSKNENLFTRGHRFSVSKLAFLVWDIICISAFLVWLNDIYESTNFNYIDTKLTVKILAFHFIILAYIIYFWLNKGYVYEDIRKTQKDTSENHRKNSYATECDDYVENKIIEQKSDDK